VCINYLAEWKLGVKDIQELLLLGASSWMETALMAGKSCQPSHEPGEEKKQAAFTLMQQWKEREGKGGASLLYCPTKVRLVLLIVNSHC